MKPDRIKISERFNENLWLTMEAPIAPEENVIEQFKNTRQLLLDAYKEMGEPKLYDVNDVLPVQNHTDKRIDAIINDINACTSIYEKTGLGVQIGLVAFEEVAKSDARIKAAYDLKTFQLKG